MGLVVEHGGEVDGYAAQIPFQLEPGIGPALLTNVGSAALAPVGDGILRRLATASR